MKVRQKVLRSSVVWVGVLCWASVVVLSVEVQSGEKYLGQSPSVSKKVDPKSKKIVHKEKPVKPVSYIPPAPKHPPKFKNGQLYKPPKKRPMHPTKKQILALKAKAQAKEKLSLAHPSRTSSPQPVPPQSFKNAGKWKKMKSELKRS
jgi:hypothetical protein